MDITDKFDFARINVDPSRLAVDGAKVVLCRVN